MLGFYPQSLIFLASNLVGQLDVTSIKTMPRARARKKRMNVKGCEPWGNIHAISEQTFCFLLFQKINTQTSIN